MVELLRLLRHVWFQFAAVMRVVPGDEALPASKEPELGIRIEATMTDPPAKKEILPRKLVTAGSVRERDGGANLFGQARTHFFVGIQQQHPIFGAQVDRILLLRHVAAPGLNRDLGAV